MDNEDLEKTRALNELNELINNNSNGNDDIEIVDIPDNINGEENKEDLFNDLTNNENHDENNDEQIPNKKKKKFNFKEKWNKLSKKQKIIAITVASIVFVLIVTLVIILVTKNADVKDYNDKKDDVVLENDNYVYQNGSITILDRNGNSLGTYECENKNENKCYVAYLLNDEDPFETPINKNSSGEIIKSRSGVFFNKYVFIFDNNGEKEEKIRLYDMNDNKVIGDYYGVKSYDVENSNVVVLKDEKDNYGLFEFKSSGLETLIDFKFQYIGLINKDKDDKIVIKDSRGYYLADYSGNVKTKAFNGEIIDYNDNYVVVKNNKYTVYNYTGEEFNKNYDYIRLLNDEYVAVVNGDNLFIRGYSDNKFNEEGYELTNKDYRKINNFDDKKQLINSTFAFDTELHDKTLTITIQNSDKTTRDEKLNLNEGIASSKLDYYSYYNGKLYFYSDMEKKELIGTYECNNKNNVTGETLNNCMVAKDSVFNDSYINPYVEKDAVIAMYNKKYVFILDSPELRNEGNTEIKFYDLTQTKVMGTYTAIDANMGQSVPSLTLVDTNNARIIARLKSGKFGVIQITNKDASVLHKFNYNYIERAGNDYIVQLENNNWQIIYGSNGYTSSEFPGRIKNYANNYVIVRNSNENKDKLYKGDGNLVLTSGVSFDYIDISNKDVFAGAKEGKLDIYTYDGEKVNNDVISLKTNKYYNTTAPAFKISSSNQNINVNIYNEDGTLSETKTYSLEKEETKKDDENKGDNE